MLNDARGRVRDIADQRGRSYASVEYDLGGRILKCKHLDVGTRRYLYDASGRTVQYEDGNERNVHTEFDELGRPVAVRFDRRDAEPEIEYSYDKADEGFEGRNLIGRPATIRDRSGVTHLSYTENGDIERRVREISALDVTVGMAYRYAPDRKLEAIIYPEREGDQLRLRRGRLLKSVSDSCCGY